MADITRKPKRVDVRDHLLSNQPPFALQDDRLLLFLLEGNTKTVGGIIVGKAEGTSPRFAVIATGPKVERAQRGNVVILDGKTRTTLVQDQGRIYEVALESDIALVVMESFSE